MRSAQAFLFERSDIGARREPEQCCHAPPRSWCKQMQRNRLTQGLRDAMLVASLATVAPIVGATPASPPVMLANNYDAGAVELAAYWVSEKYDGVRAWWTGHELLTRSGHHINAPAWFVAGWPATAMDGELWIDRGKFDIISGIVRHEQPIDSEWQQVRYMVFDLPTHGGSFDDRLTALKQRVNALDQAWVHAVEQTRITEHAALTAKLDSVIAAGGEGLMLHRGSSLYAADRSDDLLKLKPYDDAEAEVVGHLPGKGKYTGLVGALQVRTRAGVEFNIGTGLTDEQRRQAPAIGSWITYGYHGLTARGIPRFASFIRIREDLTASHPK
jgi:DNA ligase-1